MAAEMATASCMSIAPTFTSRADRTRTHRQSTARPDGAERLLSEGALRQDIAPVFSIYRQTEQPPADRTGRYRLVGRPPQA